MLLNKHVTICMANTHCLYYTVWSITPSLDAAGWCGCPLSLHVRIWLVHTHAPSCVVPVTAPTTPTTQSGTKRKMGQEECANCGRRVYLAERVQVENHVFHRSCFRCMVCNITLRPGAHRLDGGQFYCASHYTTLKRSRNIKQAIEERGISEDALQNAVKKPKPGSPLPPSSKQWEEPAPVLPPKQRQHSPPPPQSEQFYDDPLPVYTAVVKEKPGEDGKSRQTKSAFKAGKSDDEVQGKTAALQARDSKDMVRPVTLEDLPEGHYETDPEYMDKCRQRRTVQVPAEPTAVTKTGEEKEPMLSVLSKVLKTDKSAAKKGRNGKDLTSGNVTQLHAKDAKDVVRPVTLADLPEGHYETDPEYMDTQRQRQSAPQLDECLYVIPEQDMRGGGGGGDEDEVPPALPVNPPPLKSRLESTVQGTKPAENGGRREPYRPDNLTQSQVHRAVETAEEAKKRRPQPPRPAPFRRPPPIPSGALNAPPHPIRKPPRRKKKKITLEQIDSVLQQISEQQQQLEERGVTLEQEIRKNYDSKLMLTLKVNCHWGTFLLPIPPSSFILRTGKGLWHSNSEQMHFCVYFVSSVACSAISNRRAYSCVGMS